MVVYSENIINIVTALLILLLGLLIAKIISNILKKLLKEVEINNIIKEQFKLNFNLSQLITSIIKYFIYAITIILVLNQLGVSKKTLQITFLIIVILAVIFTVLAFKDWLPNLISGILILKNKNIKPGYQIKINNIKGTIKKVNLIETQIETNNKELIFIPNSTISQYEVTKAKNGKGIRSNTNRRRRRK